MSGNAPGRYVLVLALALLASLGLGVALTPLAGQESPPRPDVGANASARLAALDGLTATRETVVQHGDETRRTVERVSLRPDTGAVRAVTRTGPGDVDVRVSNGSTLWLYDRDAGTATRIDRADGAGTLAALDRVPRLVARLNRSTAGTATDGATSTPGVAPLPVVPAAGGGDRPVAGPVGGDAGAFTVSYEGTATVGDRSAYVVELAGPGSGGEPVANYTQRLWLDATWHFPLRQRTAWTQGGERTAVTTTYTDVTFDPGLDDAAFGFDPPANVTVERATTPEQRRYDSAAALRAAAAMSVPDPEVPDRFALASATRTEGRVDSVGLRYVNATATVAVAKLDAPYPPTSDGERVTVAGRTATYRTLGPERSVVWSCDGYLYKVRGRGVSKPGLLDVAGSVGCE